MMLCHNISYDIFFYLEENIFKIYHMIYFFYLGENIFKIYHLIYFFYLGENIFKIYHLIYFFYLGENISPPMIIKSIIKNKVTPADIVFFLFSTNQFI